MDQDVRARRIRRTTLAAAVVVLDVSLTFHNVWPTPAIKWTGELSVELAICIAALVVASRRFGPPSRTALAWLSAIWTGLVVGRYADVTAPALYGRQVNLFWDLRNVSAVRVNARPRRTRLAEPPHRRIGRAGVISAVQDGAMGPWANRRRDGRRPRASGPRSIRGSCGGALRGSNLERPFAARAWIRGYRSRRPTDTRYGWFRMRSRPIRSRSPRALQWTPIWPWSRTPTCS